MPMRFLAVRNDGILVGGGALESWSRQHRILLLAA